MQNWKTTLLGAGTICTSLGHLLTGVAGGDLTGLVSDIPAILAGVGLIFAHDASPAKPAV
jgi:hypothetical protein